jgi:acyl-CoA synthetase (AMP-forming)/AMP-acid ligase II
MSVIFQSPYASIEIPTCSVATYVLAHSTAYANKAALIDGPSGRTVTFAQFSQLVARAASGFSQRGLRKGDVCAIWASNSIEWAVAFHGLMSIGAITTTINPLLTVDEATRWLRETGARMILTESALLATANEAAHRAAIDDIVAFGGEAGHTPFSSVLELGDVYPQVEIDARRDVAAILCSSGTTGLPKGVQLTHYNLVAGGCQFAGMDGIKHDDVLPGQLPMFHAYGLGLTLVWAMARGATSVLMPRFDLCAFLELTERHRITRAFVVPPIVLALAKDAAVDRYDTSSLRVLISAAAPLAQETAELCARRLGCTIKQAYGMTEIVPTHVAPDDQPPGKIGSVGPCVPNTECKIVDVQSGALFGPNQTGEIWVRGPVAMLGYLNQPLATAETIDADGWVRTGDIGWVDEDGYLTVTDRLKELIKVSGYQVAPAELEALLLSHPAVRDAAVVRMLDAKTGEAPKAFVVLDAPVTEAELAGFVAERAASYKRIRSFTVVEKIPKSPSGKILRRLLADQPLVAS